MSADPVEIVIKAAAISGSVDAALALVERRFPGYVCVSANREFNSEDVECNPWAYIRNSNGTIAARAEADTQALAILAALDLLKDAMP